MLDFLYINQNKHQIIFYFFSRASFEQEIDSLVSLHSSDSSEVIYYHKLIELSKYDPFLIIASEY